MKTARSLALVVALVSVFAVGAVSTGCVKRPSSIVTPQGKAAFAADQVVIRLAEVQNAVIVAATPDATGKVGIAKPTANLIVSWIVDTLKVIKQTPNGWLAASTAAWNAAKTRIPPATLASAQGYIIAIDTLLAGANGGDLSPAGMIQLDDALHAGTSFMQ